MGRLRTKEELKILFQQRKEIKQRQAAKQREAYKKASQAVKKQLMDKYRAKEQKPQPEQNKPSNFKYSLTIYHTSTVERYSSDEDLYQTREELMEDESGSINWFVWDKLVNKLRKEFKRYEH